MPFCEESQAEPFTKGAFPCRALRSATTPGYGRRMDDRKVRDRECADVAGSYNSVGRARICPGTAGRTIAGGPNPRSTTTGGAATLQRPGTCRRILFAAKEAPRLQELELQRRFCRQ